MQRKVVLGLGNYLARDEGFGIHALEALQAHLETHVPAEWVDGGVLGLDLLSLVEDCSHLLVLDAVDAGQPAGTVIELQDRDIPLFNGVKLSEHQVGFQEVLGLALFRDHFPAHLSLVGVQPADLSAGIGLSPAVEAALPQVLDRAADVLRGW